jgi:glucose/arabinose dehydrogenase
VLVSVALALASRAAALDVQIVASGIPYLVDIQHAGDSRLFLVSQAGRIHVWDGAQVLPTAFLDLSAIVRFNGEQGLLGLAFHPQYVKNGFFYVNYVNTGGSTVIARYSVSGNPNVADPQSGSPVLTQAQPFTNHKGGQLRFGSDGYLYVALGDGGSSGDPQNNGQRLNTLLGKMLRLDVDGGSPYVIPATNPFVNTIGARGEIWSYGLRNPWRFSFDRATREMFIADVGQGAWEEINVEPAGTGGRNYGWRLMEGTHCFTPATNCNNGSLTLPILEYSHSFGCSVTGGFRYRGSAMAAYAGAYIYGDFCSGRIWTAFRNSDGTWTAIERRDTSLSITTFGEDAAGELYVSNYGASGQLYRLTGPGSGFSDDPLTSGATTVKAVHVTELRTRIDALREARGMPGFSWMDSTLTGALIRAVHVTELRSALNEVYAAAKRSLPAYTDHPLLAGIVIKTVHISEIRNAVLAIE